MIYYIDINLMNILILFIIIKFNITILNLINHVVSFFIILNFEIYQKILLEKIFEKKIPSEFIKFLEMENK